MRVVEWSPDGKRLVVGAANGNVEVYEADSQNACWPSWTIPAQESVISDIRWLSPKLYCTLGMSCVLRLCDVRDPVATLEQNCEGLQGSLSMAIVEPYVAVVGADSGYLRVVRLSAIDQTSAQNPVRRVYLQTSSFRDMRSVSLSGMTVLYTGGSEGILHQVVFPKPLWPLKGACKIDKTRISERLRWGMDGDGMHLQLDPPQRKEPEKSKRKRGGVGRASESAGVLFGERYKQPIVITRIAVNAQNNAIAVGIDGGFITWLPINTTGKHATPVVEEDVHMFSTTHVSTNSANGHAQQPEETNGDVEGLDPSSSLQNIPFKVKLKKAKRPVYGPKRKRGRPRKTIADDIETGRREEQTKAAIARPDPAPAEKADMHMEAPAQETEPAAPDESPHRTGKRARARKDETPPTAQTEAVVDEPTYGTRKSRKRKRTRAPASAGSEEVHPDPIDAQTENAHEETVPSQDTDDGDGVEPTRQDTMPSPKTRRSSPREEGQAQAPSEKDAKAVSIPLRLHIRKSAAPPHVDSARNESLSLRITLRKPQRIGKSGRGSTTPTKTPMVQDRAADADVTAISPARGNRGGTKASASSPLSEFTTVVVAPIPSGANKQAAKSDSSRKVALVLRCKPPASTGSADAARSVHKEMNGTIPLRLRIRKRRANEIAEPGIALSPTPKRSKTNSTVKGPDPSESEERGARGTKEPAIAPTVVGSKETASRVKVEPEEAHTPLRSRRVRKPSWRVRGS